MKQTFYIALAGDGAVGAGRTPNRAFRDAGAFLGSLYDPNMGEVQINLVVLPATREAFEAVRGCTAAIRAGDECHQCAAVGARADGVVDLLTMGHAPLSASSASSHAERVH